MTNLRIEPLQPVDDYAARRKLRSSGEDNPHHVERRDKLEIILTILDVAQKPTKKTHILYTAKINFYQLNRYLTLLLATNMIEPISEPVEGYIITEKGRLLLSMFAQI